MSTNGTANRTKKNNNSTNNIVGIVTNCKKLRIRSKPNVSSSTLGLLAQYEEVEIKSDANDEFYKLAERPGYVMKSFIRLKKLP